MKHGQSETRICRNIMRTLIVSGYL